jgi:DNA-binding XRE family transcriptional regulator
MHGAKACDIAVAVGVSPRTIKAIRNGRSKPSSRLRTALLAYASTSLAIPNGRG